MRMQLREGAWESERIKVLIHILKLQGLFNHEQALLSRALF
jgi:hypothetical protein